MKARTISRLLTIAAVLALMALAMMIWSLFDPRPIVLVAFMSVGQGLGTLSLLLYGSVVLFDLWTARSLPSQVLQDEVAPAPVAPVATDSPKEETEEQGEAPADEKEEVPE